MKCISFFSARHTATEEKLCSIKIEKFCDVKTLDSPVKYAEIMSSKDETVMKALGTYIADCLKLRIHILHEPGNNSD